MKQKNAWKYILFGALLLRILLSICYRGFESDVNCFLSWADRICDEGFSFYKSGNFNDYPPGYMYVLWLIGLIKNGLGLDNSSWAAVLLMKLPAILCDLGTGVLLYKIGSERSRKCALVCMSAYLFNPAIILNSTIWGQADSVITLFMLLVVYFAYKRRMFYAYGVFALGITLKPQIGFIFPVILMGIVDNVFKDFHWKNFFRHLAAGLACIGVAALIILPFGFTQVLSQYVSTLTSYPEASVNAYNFWAMLGMNWKEQTEVVFGLQCSTWGSIFLVLIFAASFFFWLKSKKRESYFYAAAFIILGTFTFSVRMHERYMFYALAFIICLYSMRPRKGFGIAYLVFSALHFINVLDVLLYYDPSNFDWEDPVSRIVGACVVLAFIGFIFLGIRLSSKHEKIGSATHKKDSEKPKGITPSRPLARLTRKDVAAMLIICAVYSLVALFRLGSAEVPETGWESENGGTLQFDFEETEISDIWCFQGDYHEQPYRVSYYDGSGWTFLQSVELDAVFKWHDLSLSIPSTTGVSFETSDKANILEFVFLDSDGNTILPTNADEYPELFDEQSYYSGRVTNLNSTYFDEIYHARTAYEYIHHMYSYENTHPPLGKILISVGIRIFGMNTFGWRIMGCLFGILMLPVLYVFSKRMTGKTNLAVVTTLIFAFDFMHFVQTRIATIDVFVTFFILLMYWLMYEYSQKSFYDTSLKRTWIPLGACGIAMGCAIACKWTGIYAAVGLAVIFFATLYKRYKEYLYAKSGASGNESLNQHIVSCFRPYAIKTLLFCCVFFIVVPAVIYTLSYIPFCDTTDAGLITRMLNNQKSMFDYHTNLVSQHPFSSKWYQWPIMTRPIYYYSSTISDTVGEGISAFGNPLVWWAGIPAFVYALYKAVIKRDRRYAFLCVGYLSSYLPWMLVSRTTYIYHYFPCVPFITLMIGCMFYDFLQKKNTKKRRMAIYGYAAAVILLFVAFYPVLSGYPVVKEYVYSFLKWFDSWVLI